MNREARGNYYRCLFWVVAVLMGIGFWLFPPISDDLGYAMPFREYLLGYKPFDFHMVIDSLRDRYFHDNARLSNVVTIFLSPVWRIVPVVISIVALQFILHEGARMARIAGRSLMPSLWIMYIVLCFPWIDQMYLVNFQINYLWAMAITMYLVRCVLVQSRCGKFAILAISLLLGLWHEGFAFPILGGIIVLMIVNKRYRTVKTLLALLGLILGMTWLFSAPCFTGNPIRYFSLRMGIVYIYLGPMCVLCCVIVYCLLKSRNLSIIKSPRFVVMIVSAVLSAMMMAYTEQGSRVGTISIVYAGIMLLSLFGKAKLSGNYTILAVLITGLVFCHLVVVDVMCYKAGKETRRVVQQFINNPSQSIFTRLPLRESIPWYYFQKPYYGWFFHDSTLQLFDDFYGDGQHQLLVVPEELKRFTVEEASRVDGNIEVYYYHYFMVMSAVVNRRCVGSFDVDFGRGSRVRGFLLMPFMSEVDGKTYNWVYPENAWIDFSLSPHPVSFNDF